MSGDRVVFISGANRGLGYEFAMQYAARGWRVAAGYRDPERSRELLQKSEQIDNLYAVRVDATDENDLGNLRDFLADTFGRLDLLINNAAVNLAGGVPHDEVERGDVLSSMEINIVGPMLAARYLRPLLAAGVEPKIVNIGSRMGSVVESSGDSTPYRLSKAALNMLTRIQAQSYADDGILAVVFTPGWVRTDMGGPNAHLSPEESVAGMLAVIDRLTMADTGGFFAHDGASVPF